MRRGQEPDAAHAPTSMSPTASAGQRGDRILTAVLLQAIPLLLLMIVIVTKVSPVGFLIVGIPFAFGLGYVYLRRWRRYLLTMTIMLTLLLVPAVWLVLSAVQNTNPGSARDSLFSHPSCCWRTWLL